MWKKIMMTVAMMIMAMTVNAQIGYKGQVSLAADAGVNHLGGMTADLRIGCYLSSHSVLGAGFIWESSRYMAGEDETFSAAEWLGQIHYQYAIPLSRLVILPTAGVLLGVESCASTTNQGNRLPYGNKFTYGIMAEINIEYVLSRHWAIAFQPRLAYLINSNFDKVKVSAGVGVKYYF